MDWPASVPASRPGASAATTGRAATTTGSSASKTARHASCSMSPAPASSTTSGSPSPRRPSGSIATTSSYGCTGTATRFPRWNRPSVRSSGRAGMRATRSSACRWPSGRWRAGHWCPTSPCPLLAARRSRSRTRPGGRSMLSITMSITSSSTSSPKIWGGSAPGTITS